MAKNEAKIKFTAETGDLNNAIKKSKDEMSLLNAQMKLNETQMKATGTSVEGLQQKHKLLTAKQEEQQKVVEALNGKLQKAVECFGENSTEATKLKTQLTNAQIAEEKLAQEVDKCSKELEDHKKSADNAEDATKELDEALDKTGESAEGFNGKIAAVGIGLAALGKAAYEAGEACIEAFNEVDEGADNVIKATGATGEAAEELEASYNEVAKGVVADFADIGSALGEVNTRFGFTGTEAEEATTLFLKFSEVTGVDATTAVQDVSRAIESAGLKSSDYASILDALTKAGQATGVSVDTLAGALTDNGAVMREMGYDTNDTIAMLAQFEKAGVNSQTVTRGMQKAITTWAKDGKDAKKEFGNLVKGIQNGSVSAGEAYEVFGTKAGVELVDAIKSGRFEYEGMLEVVEGSKGALESTFDGTIDGGYELDLTMQNCKMVMAEVGEILGTTITPLLQTVSETILPAIVDGLTTSVEWMKEHKTLLTVLATIIGVVVAGIGLYNTVTAIKAAMDAAQVTTVWALVAAHIAQAAAAMAALAPYILIVAAIAAVIAIIVLCIKYWDNIVIAVKNAWEWIKATLATVGQWIYDNVITPVVNFFTGLWESIKGVFVGVGTWVYDNIISPVVTFVTGLWQSFVDTFHMIIDPWIEIIKRASQWFYDTVIAPIVDFFKGLWTDVKAIFTNLWGDIKGVWNTVSTWFSSKVIQPVKDKFTNIWSSIKNGASNAWQGIKNTFSKVASFFGDIFGKAWSKVKNIFSTGGKIFDGIKDGIASAFTSIVNKIISGINRVVSIPFNAINSALGKIRNVEILGVSPFTWIPTISVPKIPMLAEGGILTKPTLNIAGEAGPEAIIPIDKLQSFMYGALERSFARDNVSQLVAAVEDLANRPIELSINGQKFAVATAADTDTVNGGRMILKQRGLAL